MINALYSSINFLFRYKIDNINEFTRDFNSYLTIL